MNTGSLAPEAMFVIITSLSLQKTGRQQRHLAFDALYVLTYAERPTTLWSRNYHDTYFTEEETETKRNYLALVFSQLLSSVYFPLGPWRKKTITGIPRPSPSNSILKHY